MFQSLSLALRIVFSTLPHAARTLRPYRESAVAMTGILGEQARASIEDKTFHCQGAAVYALCPPLIRADCGARARYIRFAVALQTISDYLDNLCDRADVYDEAAFRTLHGAFIDAIDPYRLPCDYYAQYPYKDDGGYLARLVQDARDALGGDSLTIRILPHLRRFATYYSDLQTYKHIAPDDREDRMKQWTAPYRRTYPDLSGWEFAAACGSTLGIFALVSAKDTLSDASAERLYRAYFPYINGLHILLDYLIDRKEDKIGGDLNFTFYYPSSTVTAERMLYFTHAALDAARTAPDAEFHTHIVYALLALYLTDPKTDDPTLAPLVRTVTDRLPTSSKRYFSLCRLLRKLGKINR